MNPPPLVTHCQFPSEPDILFCGSLPESLLSDRGDESVAKEGILRQFVKHMLILSMEISFHPDEFWCTSVSFRLPVKRRRTLFITTQIEVPFRLPANENQNILPLRSKDWTFPDETILFGA